MTFFNSQESKEKIRTFCDQCDFYTYGSKKLKQHKRDKHVKIINLNQRDPIKIEPENEENVEKDPLDIKQEVENKESFEF